MERPIGIELTPEPWQGMRCPNPADKQMTGRKRRSLLPQLMEASESSITKVLGRHSFRRTSASLLRLEDGPRTDAPREQPIDAGRERPGSDSGKAGAHQRLVVLIHAAEETENGPASSDAEEVTAL